MTQYTFGLVEQHRHTGEAEVLASGQTDSGWLLAVFGELVTDDARSEGGYGDGRYRLLMLREGPSNTPPVPYLGARAKFAAIALLTGRR